MWDTFTYNFLQGAWESTKERASDLGEATRDKAEGVKQPVKVRRDLRVFRGQKLLLPSLLWGPGPSTKPVVARPLLPGGRCTCV